MSLAACGGGGSGSSSLTPVTPGTVANASATLSLQIPKLTASNIGSAGAAASAAARATASARKPQYLSPGTDRLSFILDGTPVVTDASVENYNNAGPTGDGVFLLPHGQSVHVSYDGTSSNAYFAVKVVVTLLPGAHKFGAVLTSGTPSYVLSEGEQTYTLRPGANDLSANPLALNGVVATGYIQCDTFTQAADPSGACLDYANFTPGGIGSGGSFALTAVAADYDGFPIVFQNSLPFDNGGFSVVNSSGVVSVTTPYAPWSNPGNHITGPSGGWLPGSNFVYGQPFTVSCVNVGTATLSLKLSAAGGTFSTPQGSPDAGKYPPDAQANGVLPLGSKTVVVAPRQPITNVTVNCNAAGTITII
jgi:hypothetical protein